MKVQCPSCKKVCYRTTDSYNPDVRPHGGMVELLSPWKSYGWGKFGGGLNGGSGVMAADMLCIVCDASLTSKGRLQVVPDDYQAVPAPKTLEQKNQELMDSMLDEPEDEPGDDENALESLFVGHAENTRIHEGMSITSSEVTDKIRNLFRQPDEEFIDNIDGDQGDDQTTASLKPFVCSECGWRGKTISAVRTHAAMKHRSAAHA